MILSEQEDKKIWESWLKNDDGTDTEYGHKLEQIKKAVREIYERNRQTYGDLPYYTPHGPEHYQSVEDLIHKIISGYSYKKISIKERYYLLAAAWLHDLGMLPYVCSVVYKDEPPLPENEIRKRHHVTSEKYIIGNWFELKIDENDKEILGKLSRYHRRIEKFDTNDDYFLVEKESFRLTLLGSYLRLADSLDIGASRTPSEPYAICLAYDIPEDSKLHWIKSKLVNGIYINSDDHTITIQFKCPNKKDVEGMLDLKTAGEKIDSIINLVTENLRDELASVINIITRYGFSYFLDIKVKKAYVGLDNQMLNDLRELVINYDIMMSPSASRLIEIILVTISNILGYALIKGSAPMEFFRVPKNDVKSITKKAKNFINSIEKNILSNKPCHFGIRNLISVCKSIINELGNSHTIQAVIKKIDSLYQKHHDSRQQIRSNAKLFFNDILKDAKKNAIFNVLLYGYSELATKAICGLRDLLIEKHYNLKDSKDTYGGPLEAKISQQIRLFICEGQPKTQTTYNDRLIYHDGSLYSYYLWQRGFNNIIIIPDILAGTIMDKINIDFIVLGANGVTKDYFTHSAGHLSIVNLALANRFNKSSTDTTTKIILVTSREKYFCKDKLTTEPNHKDEVHEIEGCLFSALEGLPANRTHIWLNRDSKLIEKLYEAKISFSNPREDKISIDKIDVVISDTGYQAIVAQKKQ